jgi:hypothetical protein
MHQLLERHSVTDESTIFWVCHRSEDVQRVQREFAREPKEAKRVTVTLGRADLLL